MVSSRNGHNWILPETPRGYRDFNGLFTKWAEAAAPPNKSAEEVTSFMHSVSIIVINYIIWQYNYGNSIASLK